ncbi:MAG: HU family DNA-binding protein [Bacteroidales bacterium]|nr:HU family DNA-binding protein [Candidatus Scybalocola fimicaballi]
MNKKITISELSQLLSTNVSLINKKGWEDFLRLFFAQISEGLKADGNVKIKGLGTFKVVTVDARKSKDVNTGENTIIPAHNKISFTPDSSLAETLNKPYAHFEATYVLAPEGEVDAPESDEEEETTAEPEIITTVAAMGQTTVSSETLVEEPKVETVVEEPKVETVVEEPKIETVVEEPKVETIVKEPKVETIVEEPKVETIVEEPKVETVVEEPKVETIVEEPKVETVVDENSTETSGDEPEEKEEEDPTADEDENIDTTPEEAKKYASTVKSNDLPSEEEDLDDKSHGKKLGIAIILFLCILAVVGLVAWISDPNIVSKMRSKLSGDNAVKTEINVDPVELEEIKDIEEQMVEKIEDNIEAAGSTVESTVNETTENVAEETVEKPTPKKVEKTTRFKDDFVSYMKKKHPEMDITDQGEPIEERLGQASRLTLVSLRHYGAKDFWVYIYLYNKDLIKNPNNIKAGTKIKVPMLDNKKFVNPESEHSILTAKEIQHEFVK